MSNQFSYELDERQIRILMQDAKSEHNELMWNRLEEMSNLSAKASIDISSHLPKINLSISRSIIVPVIFIFLIGGLSAMLFSFVDFKKKEPTVKEIPLVENSKKQTEIKKPKKIVRVEGKKSLEVSSGKIIKPSATISNNLAITTNTINKKEEPYITHEPNVTKELIEVSKKKEKLPRVEKKRKNRKVQFEELPTINTAANLNEGSAEPELNLK